MQDLAAIALRDCGIQDACIGSVSAPPMLRIFSQGIRGSWQARTQDPAVLSGLWT